MNYERKDILRIDLNYAAVQALYWMMHCSLGSFTTIYLIWRGLDNTTIGLAASSFSLVAIGLQLLISDFCDRYPKVPIKLVIIAMLALQTAFCLFMVQTGNAVFLLLGSFALMIALDMSCNGFLNAQMVQFNNAGIPAHYGWPRGIGSLAYAVAAAVFGKVAEAHTPGILPKIFMGFAILCILSQVLMPEPKKYGKNIGMTGGKKKEQVHVSYPDMFRKNKALQILLGAVLMYGFGQSAGFTFMIRVLERIGKGTAEFGITELIRAGVEMPMLFFSTLVLKRISSKKIVNIAFFCGALRILTLAFAPNLFWVYVGSALNIFGSGFYIFGSVLYVNEITGPTEKVRAQSLVALCYSAGSIIGNTYAGAVLDLWGLQIMLVGAAVFNIAAGFLLMRKTNQ